MTIAFLTSCMQGAFAATPAAAADYFDLAPEELLGAEVTSVSKRAEKLSETPAAVYVITQEDILRAGVTTLPDALRLAPGVQVAQSDGNSFTVTIRGGSSVLSNKLLVMIDGRTVYNPLFAGTYWEAQDVMLEDIDRIEVVRGPGGTVWGANAVNGVINILTKSAHETQGNLVTALAGNHERFTGAARHGGAFGPDGYYRVYAKYFDRDNSPRVTGGDAYDDWRSYRSGFRMDKGDAFTLQGDIHRTMNHQLNTLPLVVPVVIAEEVTFEGANLLGRWKNKTSSGGLLTVQSYIDYSRRDEPNLLDDRRIMADFESNYSFAARGRHSVIAGVNYRYTQDWEGNTAFANLTPQSRRDHLFGAFFQDKVTLVPESLYFSFGSKVEHNDYSGVEIQPNVRMEWLVDRDTTVWGAISRAVRTPSRLEHDITLATSAAVDVVPNEDFESEKLISYELGYRHQFSRDMSVDTALFFNDYDDLATFNITGADFNFTNDMKAKGFGGEIAANWTVRENWKLSATYSYIHVDAETQNLAVFNEPIVEGGTPSHQATLRSFWNISKEWSFNTLAYYVSSLDNGNIDAHVRVDANIGWRINDDLQLHLVGQNLFEKEHREFNGGTNNSAYIERSVFGKLTWQF